MKVLISAVLFFLFAGPVQEDQNKYLLVYTAWVQDNGIYLTPAQGQTIFTSTTSQWTLPTRHADIRQKLFSSLDEVVSYIGSHTLHFYGEGMVFSTDEEIIEIVGLYKLQKMEVDRVQVGTHKEWQTKSEEIEVPSYEWKVKGYNWSEGKTIQ